LVEHQRQHRRQRKTVRLVVLGENLHHVAQQPQLRSGGGPSFSRLGL
jgi:hypothetical protein